MAIARVRVMRRPPPAVTAVGIVLVVTIVVAGASVGTPVWTLVQQGPAYRAAIILSVAVLCGLGLLSAIAAIYLVHRRWVAGGPDSPPFTATLQRGLPATAAALTVASLLAISTADFGQPLGPSDVFPAGFEWLGRAEWLGLFITDWRDPGVRAGDGGPDEDAVGAGPMQDSFPYLPLLIAVVAAAFLAAALWGWRRRRAAADDGFLDDEPAGRGEAGVRRTVADTIDAMLADPDPNTAIRGAYARLLEGLAEHGSGRRAYEGPIEHMNRVLTRLRARPQPVRRLIGLFEVARFSTHRLTPRHREQALDSLRAIASDLERSAA